MSRAVARSKRTRPVVCVGHFGAGNFGNDASLAVTVARIRAAEPDAPIVVWCTNPDGLDAALGVAGERLYVARRPGRVGWFTSNFRNFVRYVRAAGTSRLVVFPGTGWLEGDLNDHRFGAPYVTAVFAIACFCARRPCVLLGLGVSPLRHPFARAQTRIAGRLATLRSFRDVPSRDVAIALGAARPSDLAGADIVFSHGVEAVPAPGTGVIGLGLMQLPADDGTSRATYLTRMAELVERLVADGWTIELFVGDDEDFDAVDAVVGALGEAARAAVTRSPARSVEAITSAMAHVDVVVATRFHNLVSGILAGRPTVAVSYAEKSTDLVRRAGSGSSFPVYDFSVDDVLAAVRAAAAMTDEERAAMAARVATFRGEVDRMLGQLDRELARTGAERVG